MSLLSDENSFPSIGMNAHSLSKVCDSSMIFPIVAKTPDQNVEIVSIFFDVIFHSRGPIVVC